jgi:microcystin-dependent protein
MKTRFKNSIMGVAAASLALLAAAPGAHAGTEPYLGEMMYTIDDKCPSGWLPADGRLLQIAQNAALFSLLSARFGGDGRTTFALPDLGGRTVVGAGRSMSGDAPLGDLAVGAKGGGEASPILASQTPIRLVFGKSDPSGTIAAVETRGASPITTMPPWIGLTACIATTGLFPAYP